jgi:hypothetical protein
MDLMGEDQVSFSGSRQPFAAPHWYDATEMESPRTTPGLNQKLIRRILKVVLRHSPSGALPEQLVHTGVGREECGPTTGIKGHNAGCPNAYVEDLKKER